MNAFRQEIVTTEQALNRLEPAWRDLHACAGGTVFQSWDWTSAWWPLYGRPRSLRTLAVWEDDALAGLFPLFTQSLDLAFFHLPRLRFLGELETFGEYRPLIRPGREEPVMESAALFLQDELTHGRCACLDFNSLPSTDPFMEGLLGVLRKAGLVVRHDPMRGYRMTMPLPGDADAYLQSLSRHGRSDLHRDERRLLENGVRHLVLDSHSEPALLDAFFRLHESEWGIKLGGGFLHNRPRFATFLRRATDAFLKRGEARVHLLMAGSVPLAGTQAFLVNGRGVGYLSGFDHGHELARYSPGKVLASLCIRDAIAAGCREFDFQGGREPYKKELGGRLTGFARTLVHLPGRRGLKPAFFHLLIEAQKRWRQWRDWDGSRRRQRQVRQ